jgi:pilus assembly protein Flp/PilA
LSIDDASATFGLAPQLARVRRSSFYSGVSEEPGLRTYQRQAKVGINMRGMTNLVCRLYSDETGGEVLEYALIAGLIIVGSLAMIAKVGTKVLARWGSLNSSL